MDDERRLALIGRPISRSVVVVERGAVRNFADAVLDGSPVYRRPDAARAAGFGAIPAPPTFPVAMEAWGRFEELQPEDQPEGNPVADVLGRLLAEGGLILHGEQELEYHRPVFVGDVLEGEARLADVYERDSKGHTMTFLVTETQWRDRASGEPVVTARANIIHRS